jgi:putative salt-induced outer membrane protein
MIRSIQPRLLCVPGAALALGSCLVRADEPPAPLGWAGKGEVGLVLARGNADTTTADVKIDATDTINSWKHKAHLAFLYGESADFSTAQRLEGGWQTDYQFKKYAFVFGSINGENDRFDGFVYQVTAATGLGYDFIASDTTKLTATLGAGYRRLQPEQLLRDPDGRVVVRIEGESAADGVARAGVDYQQQFTQTTKLTDKLLVQSGGQNTAVANDFAVAVDVTHSLALSVGYGVRYNSSPPFGTKTTDQLTTVNLVYHFNDAPTRR